jgi:uncharacterized membrane protein
MSFYRQHILAILLIACASFCVALCLRYLLIENSTIGEMCEGWASGWACASRRTIIMVVQSVALGWIALLAAALNLLRPSLWKCSLALAATSCGLVLYNAGLAALAVALLLLTLARVSPKAVCMRAQ